MFTKNQLKKYASLVLKVGVNLQKNQELVIFSPVECAPVTRILVEEAYKEGASLVRVRWEDEKVNRLNYLFADIDKLSDVPDYQVKERDYMLDNKVAYIAIDADDPNIYNGIDEKRLSICAKKRGIAFKKWREATMNNEIRWCVCSLPTLAWAKQVFPNSKTPLKDLTVKIKETMRLDSKNPVKAWEKHLKTLNKRAKFLNRQNFEYLEFKNSLGTDLRVGLAKNHLWLAAEEMAKDNIKFTANIPTEEIFTCPHAFKVDGVLKSALPLCYQGNIIDNFSISFKDGKVVDFSAEKGSETLKELIETDEGTYRLGEVALVPKNSPIAKQKILYFNTLFDENASSHLAIGKAYPTTVKNGSNLTKEELVKLGVNDSTEHVDFMIGTSDLSVVGVKKSGEKITIFSDGDFVI
ncbi:MAG: aminopeptidase [Clostridiales bacterium]|nr:aminopeptidase [Clostridiales bacterium]